MSFCNFYLPYICMTVVTGFITFFYLWAKYKHNHWLKLGVYSPPTNWFFGHFTDVFLQRISTPIALFNIYNSTDKDFVGFYIMQKPFLMIRSPELLKQIFVQDFHVFPNHYFASDRKKDVIGTSNLFGVDNPDWKYLRNKLSPAFALHKQKAFFPNIMRNVKNLRQYLSEQVVEENLDKLVTVEVKEPITKYVIDNMSSFGFGIHTNSFDPVQNQFFIRNFRVLALDFFGGIEVFANFFFPQLNDILRLTLFGKEIDFFRNVFRSSLNNREKLENKRDDVIDILLNLQKNSTTSKFKYDDDQLLAQSGIIIVAGVETSSVTISYTLFELSKHPDIQKKVRDEIAEVVGNEELTYEHVCRMKYLNQVISETMRLYPPVTVIDRISVEDYEIPKTNIVIKKGSALYLSVLALHRDPQYYSEPLKYDPDRFSSTRKGDIIPGTYVPFGTGPRACIGTRIAILQIMAGLITILREYEVLVNPHYTNKIHRRSIFTSPADGVRMYFKRSPIINEAM